MRRTAVPAMVAALVALAGVACSTATSPKAAPPTTVSLVALRQQYFTLVTPVNKALGNFSVPRSATGAGLTQLVAPVISALATLDQQLPKVAWPAKIRRDIDALIARDKVLEADLRKAADQKPDQLPAWDSLLHADGAKLNVAVSAVLIDLGQPPPRAAATSTTSTQPSRPTPPTS